MQLAGLAVGELALGLFTAVIQVPNFRTTKRTGQWNTLMMTRGMLF